MIMHQILVIIKYGVHDTHNIESACQNTHEKYETAIFISGKHQQAVINELRYQLHGQAEHQITQETRIKQLDEFCQKNAAYDVHGKALLDEERSI